MQQSPSPARRSFSTAPPIDPSSLSRWRGRIGEGEAARATGSSGLPNREWILTKTIEAGLASGAVAEKSLERVAVDTTVMEKNIAHPTDARLYERARVRLVALAREAGGSHQRPKDQARLCSLHEPEVDCISKGKARQRYEFGTKVSLAAA